MIFFMFKLSCISVIKALHPCITLSLLWSPCTSVFLMKGPTMVVTMMLCISILLILPPWIINLIEYFYHLGFLHAKIQLHYVWNDSLPLADLFLCYDHFFSLVKRLWILMNCNRLN